MQPIDHARDNVAGREHAADTRPPSSSADQFQTGFEPDAALARKGRALEDAALRIALPRKTNSNLVSAKYRVFASRWRMFLIDHLPSPPTVGGGI